jgi:hypothetical protein
MLGGKMATEDALQMVEWWKVEVESVKVYDMKSGKMKRVSTEDASIEWG